jgi:tetratricopeptide (TPR) repeat protein
MFFFKKRDAGLKEYKLGREYCDQQKYAEAEQAVRQSAQQCEKVLGARYGTTLKSKHWLGITLYCQQKYAEAEQVLREMVQQREEVLGAEGVDTIESNIGWESYFTVSKSIRKQSSYYEKWCRSGRSC